MAHFGMMLGMMCQSLQGTHPFCFCMSELLHVPCHHTSYLYAFLGQCMSHGMGQRVTWAMHESAWVLSMAQGGAIHGNHLPD